MSDVRIKAGVIVETDERDGVDYIYVDAGIFRMLLGAIVLQGMMPTPSGSKEAKVEAALRYAELLMKG